MGDRRLAAIMFTDIANYTALGQRNEALSLDVVEKQRDLIRAVLSKYGGEEVKTMGDAFLIRFPNALDAVRCAYDIQRTVREFNVSVPDGGRIHLRVGIHLGDVVVEDGGDISGDAVNVASRIEAFADDGGVCLSRQVYDQVHNKFGLPMRSIGAKTLKNVVLPVDLYRMEMPWMEEQAVQRSPRPDTKKRVAVLPLANFSSRKSDGYLADGMTEELISSVSSIPGLTVISRTSAMSYRGTKKNVKDIGAELEVGTILEGSVRKAGARLRIAVQLVDVATQANLWSQVYDRDFGDIFAVQSEIAKEVGRLLEARILPRATTTRLERKQTKNAEAYTKYLKGRQHWRERTKQGNDKAVRSLTEAVKLDPRFALAYSALADCYHVYGNYGWWLPRESSPKAKENALKAIKLDPGLAEAHTSLAAVIGPFEHDWAGAEAELMRAIELNPSYALAHQWYSLQLWYRGRLEESYREIQSAIRLDPLSRVIRANLGWNLMTLGRLKEATEHLENMIESEPGYPLAHYNLAWTLYLDSRMEDAIQEMRRAVSVSDGDSTHRCNLACLLGLAGRYKEAGGLIAKVELAARSIYIDKGQIAFALFGVREVDSAFASLEASYRDGSDSIYLFRSAPWFAEWREDARWKTIDEGLGLARSPTEAA